MTKTKSTTEILFAHSYLVEHDRRPLGYMHPLPPLRYAQVAAYIEQEASAIVSVWDSTFRISTDSFDVEVSRVRPQIVWLYTHPTTRKAACRMIAAGRRAGAVVVVGGPDAELNPSRYLKAGADAAIRGEEEGPTLAMVLALRAAHHRASPSLLRRIPGLSYLEEDGRLWQSEGEGISVAISELPRPHRREGDTRIHLERWSVLRGQRPLALSSARGCPVSCGFCTNAVFGRPYRRRAPEEVVDEMAHLVETFQVDRLVFTDEVFFFDPTWLKEFAEALRDRDLDLPFEAQAHPVLLDRASLGRLAEVGLDRIELQAASGSESLLRRLRWSYMPADIYRAASSLQHAGVAIGLQCLVGLPGESRADLDATLEMVQVIGPEGVDVTRVDPGSPALFRKNWERVVAGPHADALGEKSSVPGPVVDAAVWWMLSCGRERGSAGLDPTQGLLQRVRRPLLKAVVRWLPGGRSRPKKGREHRSRSKGLLTDGKGEGGLSRGRRGV